MRALAHGIAEQDLIELRAPHLKGKGVRRVESLAEVEGDWILMFRGIEFGAEFRHADAFHFLSNAKLFE